MQGLIVSGQLPCSKEESTTLGAIQLRLYELEHFKKNALVAATVTKGTASSNSSRHVRQSSPFYLSHNSVDSLLFYMRRLSLFGCVRATHRRRYGVATANGKERQRLLHVRQLVGPEYRHASDIGKLIRAKNERLAKTSYYGDERKLQECYLKTCRMLSCYGCVLFSVKELVSAGDNSQNDDAHKIDENTSPLRKVNSSNFFFLLLFKMYNSNLSLSMLLCYYST